MIELKQKVLLQDIRNTLDFTGEAAET